MLGGRSLFLILFFSWEDFSCNVIIDVSDSRSYIVRYLLARMGTAVNMKVSINTVIMILTRDKTVYLLIFDVFW